MNKKHRQTLKFFELLVKLPVEQAIGIGKLLKIKFLNDDLTDRPADDILIDMSNAFGDSTTQRRAEILAIMSSAIS